MKKWIAGGVMLLTLSMYGTVFAKGASESEAPSSSKPKTEAVSENVFTYNVGDFEVSLLVENSSQGSPSILIGTDEDMLKKYLPDGTYATATSAFLVKTPEHTILVDTGLGLNLLRNMQSLGVAAEDVDAVLLTHMHGDHIGGLQRGGKPLFPNATVYLAEQEKDFWSNAENVKAALEPYGERVTTFIPVNLDGNSTAGDSSPQIFPGITTIAAFGHTPGHTAYMISSNNEKLLIWGDIVHAMEIQIPVPDVSITYDTDPVMAAAIRKTILEYVTVNKIPVAGMHLVYPAIGTITKVSEGSFRFNPVE